MEVCILILKLVPQDRVAPYQGDSMEPSDYYDTPIDKVLHFIRGVGLIKG
jgi:hypothetical protein